MENVKYAEFTGKVIEADKKLDAAVTEINNEIKAIREMVKDMPKSEILDWAKKHVMTVVYRRRFIIWF